MIHYTELQVSQLMDYHNRLVDYLGNGFMHWMNENGGHQVLPMEEIDGISDSLKIEINLVSVALTQYTRMLPTGKLSLKN